MRLPFIAILLVPLAVVGGETPSAPVIRTIRELVRSVEGNTGERTSFDLTATVGSLRFVPSDPTLSVFDETDAVSMMFSPLLETNLSVRAGDRLRIIGHIETSEVVNRSFAYCDRFVFLGHGSAPAAPTVNPEDLAGGRYDNRLVRLTGMLRDVFNDEIDRKFAFLTIACGARAVHVAIPDVDGNGIAALRQRIGGQATVVGICTRAALSGRQHLGRIICLTGICDLQASNTTDDDRFNAPNLALLTTLSQQDIAACKCHRSTGLVLAVWHGERALLRTRDGLLFRAEFATLPAPTVGTFAEVVGFPDNDMFTLGLTRAIWRETKNWPVQNPTPLSLSGEQLNSAADGSPGFDPHLQGRLASIEGLASSISTDGHKPARLYLQDGSQLLPVDISHIADLPSDLLGCRISVTGICVLNVDSWRPNAAFPHIREIFVVARTPADIRILSKAPWWTPGRLFAAIGILIASLVGFALWNRQLKKAVAVKGRELEYQIIERIGSDFKVEERTRLAVELHDSLSQTLTGIAMKINAAKRAMPSDGEIASEHLDLAARMLASCRGELKNCLWDLRNNALEDDDMANAVRRIVTPHIGDATLTVRFAALRDRFTESTAHALLRIIRELAANAVRHGHATHVQIAGAIENQTLLISVRDNGCGFDVASVPGMELGHFGLEGIRERLQGFDGTLEITSSPHAGTRAVVTITLPLENPS